MKHLLSFSVLEKLSSIPGNGTLSERLSQIGIDGIELFTLADPIPKEYLIPECVSVHLPYQLDWHSAWEGIEYEGLSDDRMYFSFGKDRDEMISNLYRIIDNAQILNPKYGVLHAGNTDMRQVLMPKHNSDDLLIVSDFCELINSVAQLFDSEEPPFTLAFENLWWEGLKLRDPQEWKLMENKLEFDNWGYVLDTGHLMNSCDNAFDEDSAINEVLDIVAKYPQDLKDRIKTIHLQLSTSAKYRSEIKPDNRHEGEKWDDFLKRQSDRATAIDQHRAFTSYRVKEIVETINPEYVTHELQNDDYVKLFAEIKNQRQIFN